MHKLIPLPHRKVICVLEKLGFKPIRQTGSHLVMGKDKQRIVIPIHNKPLKPGLIRIIIRELGITREEFFKLIREC